MIRWFVDQDGSHFTETAEVLGHGGFQVVGVLNENTSKPFKTWADAASFCDFRLSVSKDTAMSLGEEGNEVMQPKFRGMN